MMDNSNMVENKPQWVSLHTHTDGSVLDGFGKPEEFIKRAKELGMVGIGASDHGNGHNLAKMKRFAEDNGLHFVPGVEFYVAPINPLGAKVKERVYYGTREDRDAHRDVSGNGAFLHLCVWAYNNEGVHNLYELLTLSNLEENTYQKNRIDTEMLREHSGGLIVSTGCPSSEISTRFRLGQNEEAYSYARELISIFGRENVYVEIMDHDMSINLEKDLLPLQVKLAKDLGLELLATNDCHYVHHEDAPRHEEMLAIQTKTYMSENTFDNGGSRFAFNGDQYYLKSAEEMLAIFPEDKYPKAVSNTVKIAERARGITMDYNPELRPKPHIPEEFANGKEYLMHLIETRFDHEDRYGKASEEVREIARENIRKEMRVLESSDYIDYIITVYEYLNWANEEFSVRDENGTILARATGPGRGSIGGSTIAFILGISELDPIRFELFFERFLSEGRGATYEFISSEGETIRLIASHEVEVRTDSGDIVAKYAHQIEEGETLIKY